MSRSRPINRSPFRRKPWKLSQRSGRWTECNVSALLGDCQFGIQPFVCAVEDPVAMQPGTRELLAGDFDMEWADKSHVKIDRVVGDISLATRAIIVGNEWSVPILRMGLLVVEEVEDIASWVPPNLFVREDVEEFSWMWLWQSSFEGMVPPLVYGDGPVVEAPFFSGVRVFDKVHLDLRVKRKLGKKDHLVMLHHAAQAAPTPINFSAGAVHFLRAMLVG